MPWLLLKCPGKWLTAKDIKMWFFIYFRSCVVVLPTNMYTIYPLVGSRVNKLWIHLAEWWRKNHKFTRRNQGSMKTISKLANKKLQKGCCLQQWLSLSSVVWMFATLWPRHCSMNFFTSNPVIFLASEPHISQHLQINERF